MTVLIRFRVENHRSIRDEQELSLVASSLSEHPESVVHAERYDVDLLRVAAVYGANASGKSTLFDALSFMRSAVLESQRTWEPYHGVPRTPFALDPDMRDEPSLFAVDLLIGEVRYEYGFVVDSSRVLEEWLSAYPKGRRQDWMTRDASRKEEFTFSRLLAGENRLISALTRPNSLFLSAAAQNNHTALGPLYDWFSSALWIIDDLRRESFIQQVARRCEDEGYRMSLLSILEAADLGIGGIDVAPDGKVPAGWSLLPGESKFLDEIESTPLRLRHRSASRADVGLPWSRESGGTRALLGLAGPMIDVLESGGTLVVDEFDRSLHPHLALKVVAMFNDPAINPRNAQLVFNTHDTNLLDTSILRRDQVWFTEKGDDGATHLYPLTDFRARKHENLERGYLQGRYGAVPAVRTPDLRRAAGE